MVISYCTPWNTIHVGDAFWLFPEDEQAAIIMHEMGHVQKRHVLKRIFWILTLRTLFNLKGYFRMCENQELEADAFAAAFGHREALKKFIRRLPDGKTDGYPSKADRLARLTNG